MKPLTVYNLFTNAPGAVEQIVQILKGQGFTLEHIVSHGQPSPPDFWYDQDQDEWVALLRGEAVLAFEQAETLSLQAGDYLLIPSHRRHRVAAVSGDAVWLAVHF